MKSPTEKPKAGVILELTFRDFYLSTASETYVLSLDLIAVVAAKQSQCFDPLVRSLAAQRGSSFLADSLRKSHTSIYIFRSLED